MADPCADLNVVAVGGGSVALHGSDDGSVGEEPNVDLAEAGDRRNQLVHLTADGEVLFHRLRAVAQTFDAALRGDLTDQETATLITLLGKVERNLPVD